MLKLGYNEDIPNEYFSDKRFSLCYELSNVLVEYFDKVHKIDVWNFNRYNKVLDRIYPNKKYWSNVKIETLLVFVKIINNIHKQPNRNIFDNPINRYNDLKIELKEKNQKQYEQLEQCEIVYNQYKNLFTENSHKYFKYLDKNYKTEINVRNELGKVYDDLFRRKVDNKLIRKLQNHLNIILLNRYSNDFTFRITLWKTTHIDYETFSKYYVTKQNKKNGVDYLNLKYRKYYNGVVGTKLYNKQYRLSMESGNLVDDNYVSENDLYDIGFDHLNDKPIKTYVINE